MLQWALAGKLKKSVDQNRKNNYYAHLLYDGKDIVEAVNTYLQVQN